MDHRITNRQNIKNKHEVPDRKSTKSRILILMLSSGEKNNWMIYLFSIAVKRVPRYKLQKEKLLLHRS